MIYQYFRVSPVFGQAGRAGRNIKHSSAFFKAQPRFSGDARMYMRTEGKKMDLIKELTGDFVRQEKLKVNIGDTVKVSVKIKEGARERTQIFEGVVIAKKHGGISETFTVRRVSYGVGVERVFPINSPRVENVEIVRKGKVRRAKLYYLRGRTGRAAKVKERL